MSNGAPKSLRAVIDDADVCIEEWTGADWTPLTWYRVAGDPVTDLRHRGYEVDEAAVENGTAIVWLRELPAVA